MQLKYCTFLIEEYPSTYAVMQPSESLCGWKIVDGTKGLTRFQCKAIARAMNRREERELNEIREEYFRSYEVTLEAFA